jgi:hypothetical protein
MSSIMFQLIVISLSMITMPTLCDAVFSHIARAASTNSGSISRTVSNVAGSSTLPGASLFPYISSAFTVGTAVTDYATGKVTAGGAIQNTATSVASTAVAGYACTALGFLNPFAGVFCVGVVSYASSTVITSVVGPSSVPPIIMCDQMYEIRGKVHSRYSASYLEFDGNTCKTSYEWIKAPYDSGTYEILLSNDGSISVTDRSGDYVIRYIFYGHKDLNIAQRLNGHVVTDEPMSNFVKEISDILYN